MNQLIPKDFSPFSTADNKSSFCIRQSDILFSYICWVLKARFIGMVQSLHVYEQSTWQPNSMSPRIVNVRAPKHVIKGNHHYILFPYICSLKLDAFDGSIFACARTIPSKSPRIDYVHAPKQDIKGNNRHDKAKPIGFILLKLNSSNCRGPTN